MVSGLRVPRERPASPHVLAQRWIERGIRPRSVYANFDPLDCGLTRPGSARQVNGAAFNESSSSEEIRNPGRSHEGPNADPVHRRARVVSVALIAVRSDLLETLERCRDRLDRAEPFDAGHAVPAWDDQPER